MTQSTPPKPLEASLELIEMLINNGAYQQAVELEIKLAKARPDKYIPSLATNKILEEFITCDPSMIELKENIRKAAVKDYPCLIIGPSGTGKEILARALHGRRTGSFVAINCTSLPSELIESELFGHKKGSFTGALEDRIGKLQAAENGTVFFDEIGDMPLDMQAKLLRVLQQKTFCRIGENKEIPFNARIVSATNKDLKGIHFRDDLYFRLSTLVFETTSLRYRLDDILPIVNSIDKEGKFPKDYQWDIAILMGCISDLEIGNVRHIQNVVARYLTFNM